MRHVGGSLLPSSEPGILQPVQTPFGVLQVRVIAEVDTHGLFHKHAVPRAAIDAHAVTLLAADRAERNYLDDLRQLRATVAKLAQARVQA